MAISGRRPKRREIRIRPRGRRRGDEERRPMIMLMNVDGDGIDDYEGDTGGGDYDCDAGI